MRIIDLDAEPFHAMRYENVTADGRRVTEILPMHRATVDNLPTGLEAIIAVSDLQGVEAVPRDGANPRLLGLAVVEELAALCKGGILPPSHGIGVFLCGDLYSAPGERGKSGDSRRVISAFAASFRWTLCVLGNHDRIGDPGSPKDFDAFRREPGIRILHGNAAQVDGLRVGGISGVITKKKRLLRETEESFAAMVRDLAAGGADVLLMHDGPDVPGTPLKGSPAIRQALETARGLLVVRGHAHWATALAELPGRVQVLSVDQRLVVLQRRESTS